MQQDIIFNLGFLFEPAIEEQIDQYSQRLAQIQNGPYTLGHNSRPHVTLLQFPATLKEADNIWARLADLANTEWSIDFKGMVWDRWRGFDVWWLKVLKTHKLVQLQMEAMDRLGTYTFLNGLGDRFEPHATLIAYQDLDHMPAFPLDPQLAYLQNAKVQLSLGRSGPIFQFAEKLLPGETPSLRSE